MKNEMSKEERVKKMAKLLRIDTSDEVEPVESSKCEDMEDEAKKVPVDESMETPEEASDEYAKGTEIDHKNKKLFGKHGIHIMITMEKGKK